MLLPDTEIIRYHKKGNIVCEPFEPTNIQPYSLDLRLGKTLLIDRSVEKVYFDVALHGRLKVLTPSVFEEIDLKKGSFFIEPGQSLLASTLEKVGSISPHICCQLADKSTIARLQLAAFHSAGWIDPPNVLNITLELCNHSKRPIELIHGMHIVQLKFFYSDTPCQKLYDGKYNGNTTTTGAK